MSIIWVVWYDNIISIFFGVCVDSWVSHSELGSSSNFK